MCLTCHHTHPIIRGDDLRSLFYPNYPKGMLEIAKQLKAVNIGHHHTTLHTHDNQTIQLTTNQVNEIIENALCVIATGIDMAVDIWAIQWDNDYKPKHF